jgi:WD40 repeat protein
MPNNSPASRTATQPAPSTPAPYVGPRPFTQADRDIFFGRTQEAIELTSLVKAHPEVLLYAQSGAGKSSLLFAKVMPILDLEEEFDVLPVGRVRSQESALIPQHKINNIYMFNALKDLSCDQLSVIERAQLTLAEFLKRRPRPPVASKEMPEGHVTDALDHQEKRLARIVIFDQFEEIFTLHPERYKDRQDFFCQVADALKADSFLRVIFSMREDYIAEVEPYVHVLPQDLRTRYRLERLRKSNALSAVKQPLQTERFKTMGRHFADDAAEALVDRLMLIRVKTASGEKIEAPGEFVDPVHLQVVCQTLWEKLPCDKVEITKQDVEKYANVDEALSDFYENSIRKAIAAANSASETEQVNEATVRGWFEQKLITREGKRNMVFRERDTTAGLPNDVVDDLENSHLIRVEMRGGEPWYELSHDRFIPPIRESNRRFLLKQPLAKRKALELEARADEWLASHRSNALLLNRGELVDAQNWMATDAAAIGYSETLFSLIRASEAAIEHEDNRQQQLLAEAQKCQVIAEKQRARQMKVGLVATSLLLVCTLLSTTLAYNKWQRSKAAELSAQKASANAIENYGKAQTALEKSRLDEQKARQAAQALEAANHREATERKKAEDARVFADQQKLVAEAARRDAEDALRQTSQAKTETEKALQETRVAQAATQHANDALLGFTKLLEESRNSGWSLKLAADADAILLRDPEKALRLALEATQLEENEPAKWALRRAFLKFTSRSIFKGHDAAVWKAVYGADGQIVTISEDGSTRIWRSQGALEQKRIDAGVPVHGLVLTSDGAWLATEESNSTGRVVNLRDGTYKTLPGLSGPVAVIAVSPDNKLLATEATAAGDDEGPGAGATPRIWEVSTGKMLVELKGHTAAVSSIAFSPQGDLIATGSWDTTARVWDVKTGREISALGGHTDPLTSVAFDGTGKYLVTASFDGTARVWDLTLKKVKCELRGHTGVVQSAIFSPDNRLILTAGRPLADVVKTASGQVPLSEKTGEKLGTPDNTARIWDADTGRLRATLRGHTGGINTAVFSSDGKYVLTASEDRTAIVWDVTTRSIVTRLQGHEGPINSAVFSANNSSILTASDDGTAQIWDWKNVGQPKVLQNKGAAVVDVTPTGDKSFVTASLDGTIGLWDLNGVKRGVAEVNLGPVSPTEQVSGSAQLGDVAISPRMDLVVVSGPLRNARRDMRVHVWNVAEKKFARDLDGHTDPVTGVLFSRSGRYLATLSDNRAQIWSTATFERVKVFDSPSRIVSIAFTTNDKSFLLAKEDRSLLNWDMEAGTENIVKLPTTIGRADFSPDGTMIAVSSDRGVVVVWRISSVPEKVSTLPAYTGAVSKIAFSTDGSLLLTAGLDTKIRVWNTATGEPLQEFERLDEPIRALVFANENRSVIAGGTRGGVYVIECELCRPFEQIKNLAKQKHPRELTPEEVQEFMPRLKVTGP